MLAVAIVALFLRSAKSLALGVPLGIASVYLIYSGVHVIGSRARKVNPVTTSAGGRILSVPPLFRKPEFVPMLVLARLFERRQISQALMSPKLPAPLESILVSAIS